MFSRQVSKKAKEARKKDRDSQIKTSKTGELSWRDIHEEKDNYLQASTRLTSQVQALSLIGSDAVSERNKRAEDFGKVAKSAHITALALLKTSGSDLTEELARSTAPPTINRTSSGGTSSVTNYIISVLESSRRTAATLHTENMALCTALRKVRKEVERLGAEMSPEDVTEFVTTVDTSEIEQELERLGLKRFEEEEDDD